MKNTWNEKKIKCIELLTLVNIGRGNSEEAMLVTVAVAVAVADIIFPSAGRRSFFGSHGIETYPSCDTTPFRLEFK